MVNDTLKLRKLFVISTSSTVAHSSVPLVRGLRDLRLSGFSPFIWDLN